MGDFPDKLYYKIGEASKIVGVEPHVLRYWEKEFGIKKLESSKQRRYAKKDLEKFILIKKLLYEEKFTIAGAKSYLKSQKKSNSQLLIEQLEEIKELLSKICGA